jgi:hypothetical protein
MNQQNINTRNLAPLAWPLYAVAAMLIVVPLSELGAQLGWTVQPGVLNWRTGAVGLLSGVVMTPMVGLLIAVVTACVFEHRWAQRGLAILAGLGALAAVAILAGFTLDAFQLRPAVAANMQRSFTFAMVKAIINFSLSSITLAIICIATARLAWSRRAPKAAAQRAEVSPSPLVRATR